MATTESIKASGGDYATIQLWVDQYDGTTLSDEQIGQIEDDSTYDEHVTCAGSTVTTASNFMRLSVLEANRAKGVAGGGCKLHPTDAGHAIDSTNNDYFVVEHLEIHPGTATSDECLRAGAANQTMQYCLCVGRGQDTTPYQQDAVHSSDVDGVTVNVYNTMMQNFSRSGVGHYLPGSSKTVTFNIKNCSIINNGLDSGTGTPTDRQNNGGICAHVSGTSMTVNFNVDNCISLNNLSDGGQVSVPGDFAEQGSTSTATWTGTGNIASDTTAQDQLGSTNNLNNAVATTSTTPGGGVWVVLTNISVGTEDLHLKSSSENEAENANSSITFADTTGTFTDDIDGDTRTSATMDGGADQLTPSSTPKAGSESDTMGFSPDSTTLVKVSVEEVH